MVLLAGVACTRVMYPGPARPDNEVATIEALRTTVEQLDREEGPFNPNTTFKVLPGLHLLTVTPYDVKLRPFYTETDSFGPFTFCFLVRAGHTYLLRAVGENGPLRPQIIDEWIGAPIPLRSPEPQNCPGRRPTKNP